MQKHSADFFFTVTLFFLFVVIGLSVVVMGASVYGDTAKTMSQNYDTRTSLVYIIEKVRQSDGEISVEEGPEGDALVIHENLKGKPYDTWIFCGKGALREVTVEKKVKVKAFDGQPLMDIKEITFSLEDDLLTIGVRGENRLCFSSKVMVGGGSHEN